MCLAIPSEILSIENGIATVECFGIRRTCNLMLLDEEVGVGDFVVIQAGGFAVEKIEREAALATQAMMKDALDKEGLAS
jgi:hydrogenase expression/formation protein HypC